MTLSLIKIEEFSNENHKYCTFQLDDLCDWKRLIAAEYVRLRMTTKSGQLVEDLSVDGITVMNVENVKRRLKQAVIPEFTTSPFNVVRSDFGEVICYMLFEKDYKTKFAYKGVCDRELVQLPGRGIDAVGIEEENGMITLVLGEVKVSDESKSPPALVDKKEDGLRNQHRGHMQDLYDKTSNKVWDLGHRATDTSIRDLFFTAGYLLDEKRLDKLNIIAACVLIRPRTSYSAKDYGSFRRSPRDYAPASVRFFVICVPDDITTTIENWYKIVQDPQIL